MLVNLNELLPEAKARRRAVGAFNCYNYETIKGVTEAARELQTPVIMAFGENYLSNMELNEVVALTKQIGQKINLPIVLHLDHATSLPVIRSAIQAGFTSVMFDGSALSLEENIAQTEAVVREAHAAGVSVEAELGSVALGTHSNEIGAAAIYTDPREAKRFAEATNIDALAVSIGTVHGLYKGEPQIDIERLKAINALVPLPLVLHGGSGTPEDVIRQCIAGGIAKINVNTEISVHVMATLRDRFGREHPGHFSGLSVAAREGVKAIVKKYIRLFMEKTA